MIYYDPENYAECFIDEYGGYHVEEGFPKGYAGRNVLKGQSVINALQRTNEVNSGEGVDGAEKTAKRKRGCRAGKHKRNRLLKVCLCVFFYASMLLSSWSHSKGWKKNFSITPSLIFLLQVCAAAVRDNKAAAVAAEQRHQVEETFGWGVLYCAGVNIWEFFSWKNSISFFYFQNDYFLIHFNSWTRNQENKYKPPLRSFGTMAYTHSKYSPFEHSSMRLPNDNRKGKMWWKKVFYIGFSHHRI